MKVPRTVDKSVESKNLEIFFQTHYLPTVHHHDIAFRDHLTEILAYEATDIITNIKNNIVAHFLKHLNKYVNCKWGYLKKKKEIGKIKDKEKRYELYKNLAKELGQVKDDLKCFDDPTSKNAYHTWILKERTKLFPDKNKFTNDNIVYDLKSDTMSYLPAMIRICKKLEKMNLSLCDREQIKLFNIVPLRREIIPKFITIDTSTIISVFAASPKSKYRQYKTNNQYAEIWNYLVDLDQHIFHKGKGYKFNNMITTDGISVSILFSKKDTNDKVLKRSETVSTPYIQDLTRFPTTTKMQSGEIVTVDKNYVVCDPGKGTLGYFGMRDPETQELKTYRYTAAQRKFELKTKRYQEIRQEMSTTTIRGHTVKEWETKLADWNSKTASFESFKKYCRQKNFVNRHLYPYYRQYIFRKFKMNSYTNRQKSESKIIKDFRTAFGDPKDIIVVMGDWSNQGKLKGTEPTICKRFRKIFKLNHYKLYLLDEFRTSKTCSSCKNELEKFLYVPHENGNEYLCHKLLRCKSSVCKIIHNRDKNAVKNMLYLTEHLKKTKRRPAPFGRSS